MISENVLTTIIILGTCICVQVISVGFGGGDTDDEQAIKSGRRQYAILSEDSKSPRYGTCWKEAIADLTEGCRQLTDETQMRLAIRFSNCFLDQNGRPTYKCSADTQLNECTKFMSESAFSLYQSFFTHTQNMCFFLQSQTWQENTENTIGKLSDTSENVAAKLEESTHVQEQLLDKQKESLESQDMLLRQGKHMENSIKTSTNNVKNLFIDFKESTQQQRMLIGEVFDRITKLQSLVLGEFTGLYSVIFYALSLVIAYLVTCTSQTVSARFWICIIMTLNIVAERTVVHYFDDGSDPTNLLLDTNTTLYHRLWVCRKVSVFLSVCCLALSWYKYKDYDAHNNALLREIKAQNSELKALLRSPAAYGIQALSNGQPAMLKTSVQSDQVDLTCNEYSDSDSDTDSGESDHTFTVDDREYDDDNDSLAGSFRSSRESTPALLDELRILRSGTPLREITPLRSMTPVRSISPTPMKTAYNRSHNVGPGGEGFSTAASSLHHSLYSPCTHQYNLRCRRSIENVNPIVNTESADSFSKTVKRLAKIATRNSTRTRYTIERNTDKFTDDYTP